MRVDGTVRVPGDKSISHRSLMLAALADGASRVRGILRSADVQSTAGVLRALGADIPPLAEDLSVAGRGLRGLRAPVVDLDCGNSGTTTRLMAGVVAGHPIAARFVGDASLSRRPMRRVARPLEVMGAEVRFDAEEGRLPMRVRGGSLSPIRWKSETASAQVKSALLLAGLVGGVEVTVEEPALSRDHTERFLAALGVGVARDGTSVTLTPVGSIPAFDLIVPGDPSSAAFFAALGALASAGSLLISDVCLNESRTGFFRALRAMGGSVQTESGSERLGEPVGTVRVAASSLRGVELDPAEVPSMIDEIPMLACVAARAEGLTTVTGAAELRVKESDRIATVVNNLRRIGAEAEELPDGLRVKGSDSPLRGRVETEGDHRIAMAFGVLGALPGNEIEIDDPQCVSVSYPTFWEDLRQVVTR
ncbi:MAG TPA: 3-phosphoshikimate 1-carboxyvinyltransferase [Gemmatimonadaceae bacterium]|nr:3-phosphoshikimate 1-carboxyvinyltransferase [Gemmatimonadaceae bacterium]